MQVGAWYRVGMSVLLLLARCVNALCERAACVACPQDTVPVAHVRSLAGVGGVHYVVAAPARALVLRLGSRGMAIGWVRVEGGVEGGTGAPAGNRALSGSRAPRGRSRRARVGGSPASRMHIPGSRPGVDELIEWGQTCLEEPVDDICS